eukprot:CAMPEP_0176183946 /NCGR_PEP_ID=MMETSP0121_2-20121125/552_1 /TAXON_ID=160619 /ORGANISM="Kryptoperidinium foliaceum, Strain CCMP 1326" /LENGTH=163 /DNA_ID=CAMNT_0017522287 /DNA_START=124 /DNA_END=611 /DNA_ORIENTATION=+
MSKAATTPIRAPPRPSPSTTRALQSPERVMAQTVAREAKEKFRKVFMEQAFKVKEELGVKTEPVIAKTSKLLTQEEYNSRVALLELVATTTDDSSDAAKKRLNDMKQKNRYCYQWIHEYEVETTGDNSKKLFKKPPPEPTNNPWQNRRRECATVDNVFDIIHR